MTDDIVIESGGVGDGDGDVKVRAWFIVQGPCSKFGQGNLPDCS